MRRVVFSLLTAVGVLVAGAPAHAQQGFALKGFYVFNSSTAQEGREAQRLPAEDGFGIGAEYVLPIGLGIGVQGYTAGETKEFDAETSEFTVLGEANYFLRLPLLSPYAGVHAGLGRLGQAEVSDPNLRLQDRTRSQLGWQVGVRFQPFSLLGVDLQYRRMSTSADAGQDGRLERNQLLLGVALF